MAQEKETIDFKSSIIDKKSCSIIMDVEVPENIVANEINSAFSQIQQHARIDGFRQGKVPMSVIKQKFIAEAKDRAVENIIGKTILNVLEKEAFIPIDSPVVEEFNYELGQSLKYRFTAECHPKIDAKDYKNISVTKEVFKITDESLSQSLDALREGNAKLVPSKSEDITNKSFVSIDYDAFDADGKALPKITARGHMLDLSSESTPRGFKEALVGAKIGDEKDANIGYPADHLNKTLAGKTISFKIKAIGVKEKELPELSDDFAKDMGTENLEVLKTKVKETIEVEEKCRQDASVEKQIVDYILEKNKFEVPQFLVEEQKKTLVKRMKDYMQNQGVSKEYVEKETELKDAKFKEEAEKDVRLHYILNAVYLNENLAVTDADIEAEKNKMKSSNPGKESAVDKYFVEKKEDIMLLLKKQKSFEFLIDNAKMKIEEKDMPLKKN